MSIGHLPFLFGKNIYSVLLSIKKNQVVCVFDVELYELLICDSYISLVMKHNSSVEHPVI